MSRVTAWEHKWKCVHKGGCFKLPYRQTNSLLRTQPLLEVNSLENILNVNLSYIAKLRIKICKASVES
jgi:hypothetical protein